MVKCENCKYKGLFNVFKKQYYCKLSRDRKCVNINKPRVCMYFKTRKVESNG